MTERDLWGSIRSHCTATDIHWQRVEAGVFGMGTPDGNGCRRGVEAWLELKIQHGQWIEMQSSQVAWFTRGRLAGRNIWMVARHNDEIKLFAADTLRTVELIPTKYDDKGRVKAVKFLPPVPNFQFSVKRAGSSHREDWERFMDVIFLSKAS